MTKMKTCIACRRQLALTLFDRRVTSPDGRTKRCRQCATTGRRPAFTEKEKRMERKAYIYAHSILFPQYKDMDFCMARARAAYGV